MKYEGQICRGPMERSSFMLPVAVGCSYNRCRFCTLFKHLKYRELPIDQVEAELRRVRDMGGDPSSVFLGDGNALGMDTERLLDIIGLVHSYFPSCRSINMDATVTNIQGKSDRELKALAHAEVRHLYLGIESGLDDVLRFMQKDHTLDQAYAAISRLRTAGMIYDAHIMTGIAGKGRGLENAGGTAEFFNRTKPERVVNFSLFLHRVAPLNQDIERGAFVPADELENLMEERELLKLMETGPVLYDGFHDFISFRVRGTLPQHKGRMLDKLDRAISLYKDRSPLVAFVNANLLEHSLQELQEMDRQADGRNETAHGSDITRICTS